MIVSRYEDLWVLFSAGGFKVDQRPVNSSGIGLLFMTHCDESTALARSSHCSTWRLFRSFSAGIMYQGQRYSGA